MTRIVMTPAILGALATAMVAGGLAVGCSSKGTATGQPDAQAPGLDAPVGSGGAAGSGSDAAAAGSGGVPGSGGVTVTAGSTQTGGATGSGGTMGAGGTAQTGGTTGAAGTTKTGGMTGAGGTTGAGGATSLGGATSSGGVHTSGGSSGTGGAGGDGGGTSGRPDASADKPPVKEGAPCGSDDDCAPSRGNDLACYSPGEPGSGGLGSSSCYACQGPSDCASDADCVRDGGSTTGTMICDVVADASCYCYMTKFCVLGCRTKADCASGQACNESNRCEKTCVSGDGTCPVDFTCNGSGFCRRISCKSASDCSAFCVNGRCYESRGTCQLVPA